MSADITGFEVQYKNNLAAIGFHKAMTAEDESNPADVCKGVSGGMTTNLWYAQSDATPILDVDVVFRLVWNSTESIRMWT